LSVPQTCWQMNLQTVLGGGEIYTRFTCEALVRRGWQVVLFVDRKADFWRELDLRGVELRPLSGLEEIDSHLPSGALVLTHNLLDRSTIERWSAQRLCAILHMPLYERTPAALERYRRLFAVSRHVLDSARPLSAANLHDEALLGVADLAPRGGASPIVLRSPYDWDRRKLRDCLLAAATAFAIPFANKVPYVRKRGLALGIVSRITPIKQFPRLFAILAPILAARPEVTLEIFGSGGYASLRDLKRALAPLGDRARFWGRQSDVAGVYGQLDYVLSGLPEKEALGLNLIEAQACGTPVLAVRAPPFTETVIEGASGFLYPDPREDGGAGFAALLDRICSAAPRPDPRLATEHLARFSLDSFGERLVRALATVA